MRAASIAGISIFFRGYWTRKWKYGPQNHLFFTGFLSEEQMCRRYLRSNVFVYPSTIENSPNSLGEAQLLGMPCISSYVGGVPDMMAGQEHWLYRFEEVEMLVARVCEIFAMGAAWDGSELRQPALRRHDGAANAKALCDIYKSISRN